MQKIIQINDGWKFSDRFENRFLEPDFCADGLQSVSLPHCVPWKDGAPVSELWAYIRTLDFGGHRAGSSFVLNFSGVMNYCEVYLNGIFVTSHFSDTPFSADVTAQADLNGPNVLLVKVDAGTKAEVATGYSGFGGMYREAGLTVRGPQYIRDCYLKTGRAASGEYVINADVELGDFYPDTVLSAEVYDGQEKVAQLCDKTVLGRIVPLKGFVSGGKTWSPESPDLYRLVITLYSQAGELDVYECNMGFAKPVFARDSFYINGRPQKLIGLVRRDEYPEIFRALPENLQREDARLIKRLGFNAVRTRGVPSAYFVDECDKIGLMVAVDLSAEHFVGEGRWREVYLEALRETVGAFKNHPSVIAWGVRVNNSRDCNELYSKAVRYIKEIDPARACFGSRGFMASHLYEDVFAFNDYSRGRVVPRQGKTSKLFVPYMISEHTGSTFPVKHGADEKTRERAALHHLRVTDKILKSKTCCGCFAEGLADSYDVFGGGEGEHTRFYGICDGYRNLKLAAYAYLSQTEEPVLQLSTGFSHEFDGSLTVFTGGGAAEFFVNGRPAGVFKSGKRLSALAHPPIAVQGIMALPEGVKGLSAWLLRQTVRFTDKRGYLSLRWYQRLVAFCARKALRLTAAEFMETVSALTRRRLLRSEITVKTTAGEAELEAVFGVDGQTLAAELSPFEKSRDTYSVVKINVRICGAGGRTLRRAEPVWAQCSGPIEAVGAAVRVLREGVATFMFKTAGEGEAAVTIGSDFGTKEISFTV